MTAPSKTHASARLPNLTIGQTSLHHFVSFSSILVPGSDPLTRTQGTAPYEINEIFRLEELAHLTAVLYSAVHVAF